MEPEETALLRGAVAPLADCLAEHCGSAPAKGGPAFQSSDIGEYFKHRRSEAFAASAAKERDARLAQLEEFTARGAGSAVLRGVAGEARHVREQYEEWRRSEEDAGLASREREARLRHLFAGGEGVELGPYVAVMEDAEEPEAEVAAGDGGEAGALVVDFGGGVVLAGVGGDDAPRASFPLLVGRRRSAELEVVWPLERGMVRDWEAMEKVWRHTFCNELKVDARHWKVLVAEPPLNPASQRAAMAELLLETFGVVGVAFQTAAVLTTYAMGRVSSMVLDVGAAVTHTVPVYEGFLLLNGVCRMDFGEEDVADYLMELLSARGSHRFSSSSERAVAQHMMRAGVGRVALDLEAELRGMGEALPGEAAEPGTTEVRLMMSGEAVAVAGSFQRAGGLRHALACARPLPFGSRHKLFCGAEELQDEEALPSGEISALACSSEAGDSYSFLGEEGRSMPLGTAGLLCQEAWFRPSLVGREQSLQQLLWRSLRACDIDTRPDLSINILTSGAATRKRNFKERLSRELQLLKGPEGCRVRVTTADPAASWIGGSIWASLSTTQRSFLRRGREAPCTFFQP